MDKKFREIKKHLDTNYKEKYTYDKDGRAIVKMNIKKDGEFLSNFNYEGDNNLSDEAENFFINSTVKLKRDDKIIKIEDKKLSNLLIKRKNTNIYAIDHGSRIDTAELSELIINYGNEDVEYVNKQTRSGLTRYVKRYNKAHGDDEKHIDLFTLYVCGVVRQIKQDEEINNYKIRIKDLYEWFAKNNHGEEITSRGKKRIIKTVYTNW